MSKVIFQNGRSIEDYSVPYIVAEVNSSHNGSMDTAKKMIDAAVEIGCDCVKFQSWSASSLYSKTYYKENTIARRFVDKFSMAPEQLKELSQYCHQEGIEFSSTPYCEEEVDFLIEECDVPYIKIASMEINNFEFLKYIGSKRCPIVLSTGMSDMDEVEKTVQVLEEAGGSQIVLLHCVSIYPAVLTAVNLNNIIGLRERFPKYPIGFSDHTNGDAAAVAATALGAGLIEKHLTLDHSKLGMDNGMATEPPEFKVLVSKCRDVQIAMGTKERIIQPQEIEQRKNMRRSIIAKNDILKGSIITKSDLYTKRPGTGISPEKIDSLVGKIANNDIEADTVIRIEDICDMCE